MENDDKVKELEKRLDAAEARAVKSKSETELRVANIYKIANMSATEVKSDFDIISEADKAIKAGKSATEFQEVVFNSMKEKNATQTPEANIGASAKEC